MQRNSSFDSGNAEEMWNHVILTKQNSGNSDRNSEIEQLDQMAA